MTRNPYRDWQEPNALQLAGIALLAIIFLPFILIVVVFVSAYRAIFLQKS